MRSFRFLLPFTFGALSMLAAVIAVGRVSPRTLDQVRVVLGSEAPPAEPVVRVVPPLAPPVAVVPAPPLPEPSPATAPARVSPQGLLIPVQGVAAAGLVDSYRQARGRGLHNAIDIMAPRGTPVLASSDGVVMKLFKSDRGGTTLYQLAPDRRTIYYYAHLDRYVAGMAEGRALRRGEVLGYVGNTGDAGPGNYHLHFEVTTTSDPVKYWGGVSQNPYPLLR